MQFLYPAAQQTKFLSLRSDVEVLLYQLKALQKLRTSGPQRSPWVSKGSSEAVLTQNPWLFRMGPTAEAEGICESGQHAR